MDNLLISIEYKDPLWIAVAFLFGALGRAVGLPPLVGFLAAGFTLNYLGVAGGAFLNEMADIGVTLLLFTIGLKLRIKELLRPEIFGVTLLHMAAISAISFGLIFALQTAGAPLFKDLDTVGALVVGFALSFSSTVFVVKVLENRGDFLSQYGRIAIGVLIVQDIAAVVFLGFSEAKLPSVWAGLVILLLLALRPLLLKLFLKVGHGELLVLFGLVMALGGAALFELVDLKADLGALVFGVLLAGSPKSDELAKALFSIKELFLVGFFLSIGMAGIPDVTIFGLSALLLLLLLPKIGLFFVLFSAFRLRTRSAVAASLALGNYSEFGLIVAAVAVAHGWLSQEWLVLVAILVAASFLVSSVVNGYSDRLFARFQTRLKRFQSPNRLPGDEEIDLFGVRVLVCGMGRIGRGAFDHLLEHGEQNMVGIDFDTHVAQRQTEQGRATKYADVSSPDFWQRLDLQRSSIEWVLLCTPNLNTNVATAKFARDGGFKGFLIASAQYSDDEQVLKDAGVDAVFNVFSEAGAGLAQHGQELFGTLDQASGGPEA